MDAQHVMCKNSFSKIVSFQYFITLCKNLIVVKFELSLFTVKMNMLSIPHSHKDVSIFLPILSLLWSSIWQKFKILLCNFQASSIKWHVRHIYFKFWIEVHVSVISYVARTRTWTRGYGNFWKIRTRHDG